MVNRLVASGRKHDMEINIEKSQIMGLFRRNELLRINVGNKLIILNSLEVC